MENTKLDQALEAAGKRINNRLKDFDSGKAGMITLYEFYEIINEEFVRKDMLPLVNNDERYKLIGISCLMDDHYDSISLFEVSD